MYARPFVVAQNGTRVGMIGGGNGDNEDRDDIEEVVVIRKVNSLICCLCYVIPQLGTGTDAS
ncbi:hypothetical protein C8J55DRAFT_560825 [Lentinula edodes]|uniref:Uncharacterized protein n=1 Tax=Lentinula lateritia TaxID=40482 RepID=A0A9W9ACM5_9AGAR|nr:hypothetical protein C8J55DRAFT_560825 [Lentinula edodes]